MYNTSKYIVGEVEDISNGNTHVVAVVFPETISHATVAQRLFVPDSIVGAGFCWVDGDEEVHVDGRSAGLGINNRPKDKIFVQRALGLVK